MTHRPDWQSILSPLPATPEILQHRVMLERRFMSYVTPNGECAEWTGGKAGKGYGVFFIVKRQGKGIQAYAHRVSWVLNFGPIPQGMEICHRCDNPACVRPSHLFLGTRSDNMRDCVSKGRLRNGNTRLTAEIATAIKQEYAAGNITQQELAEKYGINFRHVSNIALGRRWKGIK